jgi:hypothetical protein
MSIPKASNDGIIHLRLLGFWTVPFRMPQKELSLSETEYVSTFR